MDFPRAVALAVAALLLALGSPPLVVGAPAPLAIDFSGSGNVTDFAGFGLYGASVEVTIWGTSGIVAGPLTLDSGAQGAYSWAFSQVPEGSLQNITLAVTLPWAPNFSIQRELYIANATPQASWPGEDFAFSFFAQEDLRLTTPSVVDLARGTNVTVPYAIQNTGNISVGRSALSWTVNASNVTAQFEAAAPPDELWPGQSLAGNLTVAADSTAPSGLAVLNLTVPSLSGTDFVVGFAVSIRLHVDSSVQAISTSPDPLREGELGQIVLRVENLGNDYAYDTVVRVQVFNATIPNLYNNFSHEDLLPGVPVDVVFLWAAPWSPAPYDVVARVFLSGDIEPANDAISVQWTVQSTNEAPAVNFTSPAQHARVAGEFTVSGTTLDAEGDAVNTSFSVDGGPPFLDLPGPSFAFVWNVSALGDGPHTLQATGRDERGNTSNATLRVVVLNRGPNAAPTLAVLSPSPGETVGAFATFFGTAADERGELVGVYIMIDTAAPQLASGTANWSYPWNTTGDPEGPHVVRIWAWDGIDRSSEVLLNITVNRSAPAAINFSALGLTPASPVPGQVVRVSGTAAYDTGVLAGGALVTASVRGFAAVVSVVADARGAFVLNLSAPQAEGNFTVDLHAQVGNVSGTTARSLPVARGAAPDLEVVPGSFTWDPDPPTTGTSIRHTVAVENSGDLSATATLRVYDVTGSTALLLFERDFAISARFDATFSATYTEGKHNLSIRIEDVSPADADLSDNTLAASITVLSVPDFSVVSITPSIRTPAPGQNITLLILVTNVGQVSGSASVELWDGVPLSAGSQLLHQEFVGIAPGAQERVLGVWKARLGNTTLYVSIVLANPQETNITNNHANLTVVVEATPPPVQPPFLPGSGALGAAVALVLSATALALKSPRRARRDRGGSTMAVKGALICVLAAALAFAALPPAALGGLEDARQVPGPLNGLCQTCHTDPNGGAALNSFGADYADAYNQSGGLVNWTELGAKDSDGDGYGNADEWGGSYLPGDPKSNPETGVKYGGFGGGDVANVVTGALALLALSVFGIYMGFRMLRKRNARVARKEAAAAAAQEPKQDGPG